MKIRKAGEGHDLRDSKRLKGAPRGKGGKVTCEEVERTRRIKKEREDSKRLAAREFNKKDKLFSKQICRKLKRRG